MAGFRLNTLIRYTGQVNLQQTGSSSVLRLPVCRRSFCIRRHGDNFDSGKNTFSTQVSDTQQHWSRKCKRDYHSNQFRKPKC